MGGMDMVVNDVLLSPIMDMEAMEDMDTDMDVKSFLVSLERKQSYHLPKLLSNEELFCAPSNFFISK